MNPTLRGLVLATVAAVVIATSCGNASDERTGDPASDTTAAPSDCAASEPEALRPEILRTVAHDPTAYTQGLVFAGDRLLESAGRYDESRLRSIDPDTGAELDSVDLPDEVFAEGLAVGADGEVVQLTWKEGIAYRWDADGFEPLGEFSYDGEGWGLTTLDDGRFVMSDGSDELTVRDPQDFSVISGHRVVRADGPSDELNELEWDGASVWANRYQSDELLRIDPTCWTVTGVADLSAVRDAALEVADEGGTPIDVTNGVASVPGTNRFLVTGKWWPTMYEVTFVPVG